jgi:hypothetical protein
MYHHCRHTSVNLHTNFNLNKEFQRLSGLSQKDGSSIVSFCSLGLWIAYWKTQSLLDLWGSRLQPSSCIDHTSPKLVWPFSLAWSLASACPVNPFWHTIHLRVKRFTSVNCLFLLASSANSSACTRTISSLREKMVRGRVSGSGKLRWRGS